MSTARPTTERDLGPAIDWSVVDESRHVVQFYEGDAFLLDSVRRFIGGALGCGEAGIVIATRSHRETIAEALQTAGVDVPAARAERRYVELDAADTLATFSVEGGLDAARFEAVVGEAIRGAASARGSRVRAFGEMVALLWAAGKQAQAIHLEELWNGLSRRLPFSLFCAYPIAAFRRASHAERFDAICDAHAHVIPAESYVRLGDSTDRLRAVTRLQQKARALADESAGRGEAERSLERRERELADFLENAVEGIHEVDAGGIVRRANRALLALLGYARHEHVGHPVREFHVRGEAFDDFWRRTLARETLYDYPAELRCKDGSVKHVLIHSNGSWEGGRLLHTRCFIRDVTERKRLEEELQARIEQVVANLLTNAAKYSEPGGRIDLRVERLANEAVISVRDTGIGIPPEMLPHVFDLFVQADRALDRSQGGLGIGLTVARSLVELHGGRIEARGGGAGKGSEFVVRLPAMPPDAVEPAAPDAVGREGGSRARVLVVEDNPDAAESLTILLELLGHRVRVVHDGVAALEAAEANEPDVMSRVLGAVGSARRTLVVRAPTF